MKKIFLLMVSAMLMEQAFCQSTERVAEMEMPELNMGEGAALACPFREPVLDFWVATKKDVIEKERQALYEAEDGRVLVASLSPDACPNTVYTFVKEKDEEEKLLMAGVLLPKAMEDEAREYLNRRYPITQLAESGEIIYTDEAQAYGVWLFREAKSGSAIGVIYAPVFVLMEKAE